MGRREREKRRRERSSKQNGQAVALSQEPRFVALRAWLKRRDFRSKHLIPALFPDTGRGLMATKPIEANGDVVVLPESCLLTTATVLRSYLGDYIKRWTPPVSPLLALCAFLVSERHFGNGAEWKPYVDVLPATYTCPAFFSDDVMNLLPSALRREAQKQRLGVQELQLSALRFFGSLQPLFSVPVEGVFTLDAICWAWGCVNTRTVYMEHPQSPYLSRERNVYALAPYLDLLNHGPDVQVEAGFNKSTNCYEVRSIQGCRKHQQAFICYGPHDNQRLLLEYGFVVPGNPHSVVYVDQDTLLQCLNRKDPQLPQKLLFLKEKDFLVNQTFGVDGPSWRLMTALRLLSLKPEQYACWKSVLLGAAVSQDGEEWSIDIAQRLCHHLMTDNTSSLDRLSQLRRDTHDHTLREQLDVVEGLRLEEQRILGQSQEVLQRQKMGRTANGGAFMA